MVFQFVSRLSGHTEYMIHRSFFCGILKGSFHMVRRLPAGPREGRSCQLAGLV